MQVRNVNRAVHMPCSHVAVRYSAGVGSVLSASRSLSLSHTHTRSLSFSLFLYVCVCRCCRSLSLSLSVSHTLLELAQYSVSRTLSISLPLSLVLSRFPLSFFFLSLFLHVCVSLCLSLSLSLFISHFFKLTLSRSSLKSPFFLFFFFSLSHTNQTSHKIQFTNACTTNRASYSRIARAVRRACFAVV